MTKFVGRKRELEELNRITSRGSAQFILVYGRRRVGKTTLLLNLAEESGRPYIYWVANMLAFLCIAAARRVTYHACYLYRPKHSENHLVG